VEKCKSKPDLGEVSRKGARSKVGRLFPADSPALANRLADVSASLRAYTSLWSLWSRGYAGTKGGGVGERGVSGGFVSAGEDGLAKAFALFLEVIQETLCPDEFRGEDAEADQHDQEARSRREDHRKTEHEQSEANNNLEPTLSLLDRPNQHLFVSSCQAESACQFDAADRSAILEILEQAKVHSIRLLLCAIRPVIMGVRRFRLLSPYSNCGKFLLARTRKWNLSPCGWTYLKARI